MITKPYDWTPPRLTLIAQSACARDGVKDGGAEGQPTRRDADFYYS